MIKLKPIVIPRSLAMDAQKMRRAIKNGMEAAAKGALVDLKVTTQTWNHKPGFDIQRPSDFERVVGTDDDIYRYVDEGTEPHVIVAKTGGVLAFPTGGRAKTVPRVIGSGKGARGGAVVFRPRVQHPGTDAREFVETIGEKWNDRLGDVLQRSIDSEV
jgi:hypothetical protein